LSLDDDTNGTSKKKKKEKEKEKEIEPSRRYFSAATAELIESCIESFE
jgi:hypothetical protein